MRKTLCCALLGLLLCAAVRAEERRLVLSSDFEKDPYADGWITHGSATIGENVLWSDEEAHSGKRAICSRHVPHHWKGGWQSPPFPVTVGQYYRLTFWGKTPDDAAWFIKFFDEFGQELEGDHYSAFDASADWQKHEFFFKAKFRARTAAVVFHRWSRRPAWVDDVTLETATAAEAAEWFDRIYERMPPLPDKTPAGAGTHLRRAMRKLKEGGPFRIVLLGDSISNDLANTPFEMLLQRHFPKAEIDIRWMGSGGTGWRTFKQQIQQRVIRHDPDLVILLALSNKSTTMRQDLTQTILRIREGCPETDLLLVTNPDIIYKPGRLGIRSQRPIYLQVAQEQSVELIDLFPQWTAYVAGTAKPLNWFLRDAVHNNVRGRQVLARAVVRHLAKAGK